MGCIASVVCQQNSEGSLNHGMQYFEIMYILYNLA